MSGGSGTGAPIPFAPPDITPEDVQAVTRVLEGGWLTTGAECAALEEELASYLGGVHVVAMSSCTSAMEAALAALDLPPGARVAVPTWTFVSTALVPTRLGLLPVLVDVEPDTLNMAAHSLEAALEAGARACVTVHFGGVPVPAAIHDLCRSASIPLIEDAAHALGASDHRGRLSGRGTVAACFSFYATKNLTSAEGGALATENPELAAFARSYRLHGLSADAWARYGPDGRPDYELRAAGIKANLPDVLAALARSQLSRFDDMQARRRSSVGRYRSVLFDVPGVRVLPPGLVEGSADHLLVVELAPDVRRDGVVDHMRTLGVSTSVHFRPLHRFCWIRQHAEIAPGGVPTAERLHDRVLSLPLSSTLDSEQINRTAEALRQSVAFATRPARTSG